MQIRKDKDMYFVGFQVRECKLIEQILAGINIVRRGYRLIYVVTPETLSRINRYERRHIDEVDIGYQFMPQHQSEVWLDHEALDEAAIRLFARFINEGIFLHPEVLSRYLSGLILR